MQSSSAYDRFPYAHDKVFYMELFPNGELTELKSRIEKMEAFLRATAGESKVIAVLPGNPSGFLFHIDNLNAFCDKQGLL